MNKPIQAVFPGMREGHDVYKNARRSVQRFYKQWKTHILTAILTWVERWIKTAKSLRRLSRLSIFKTIKAEIAKDWDDSWLETVFKFKIEVVNFSKIIHHSFTTQQIPHLLALLIYLAWGVHTKS